MHASGRGIFFVMCALYAGLGLALPIVTGMSILWLVLLNLLGTTFAGVLGLMWFSIRILEVHRRHLVEWTSDLRLLDAQEFEWLVAEIYRREGWQVAEVGGHGAPDGNVDLRMSRGKEKAIVQCKRWTSWLVGVDDIRGFAGTLMAERSGPVVGHFVTLSDFNDYAIAEAKRTGIVLVGGAELYRRAEKLRRSEPCPTCASPMILDRSMRGWWFRCTAAGCGGKRDLGSQPGRAVELLVDGPDVGTERSPRSGT